MHARDLDPEGLVKPESFKVWYFVFINLESALCLIIAAMFIAIGAARVLAGSQCNNFYQNAEKNATAIAAILLFSNLLNLLRPIKIFGVLFLIIYRVIVTDLFRFTIVYMTLFLAFLLAIQTIYSAENVFIQSIVDSTLVESTSALATLRKSTTTPSSSDPALCQNKVMSTSDTAFRLLTMSLGDGFNDILQDSRTRADQVCAGFKADGLLIIIFFAWIVMTNILEMNLLIAMLTKTFDTNMEISYDLWVLNITAWVLDLEKRFPELEKRAHRPNRSIMSPKDWADDIILIGYCIPEINMVVRAKKISVGSARAAGDYSKEVRVLLICCTEKR
jgi:hypothetical protein